MQRVGPVSLVLWVLLAACGTGPRLCTLMGATSAISINTAPGVRLVELCIDEACLVPTASMDTTIVGTGSDAVTITMFGDTTSTRTTLWPVSDTPATYDYRVVVAVGDDTRTLTGELHTVSRSPNGEGCPPKVAEAALTINADD